MTTVGTLDDQRTMTDSVRQWWSTVDPFTPLVGLVSLLIYVLNGFGGYLGRDLGLYVYAGQMVADGEPPYVAILNRAGPLAHLLPGLGVSIARVFGFDDVLGARLLFCAFAVGAVCATYMVGRDLFTSRVVGLVTAATMLTFHGFIHYASNGPREKTFMVLCLVWVMWCGHRQRWLTAGVFIALATLTWQPAFLLTLIITVISILLTSDRRIVSLGRVMVGGLIPTAICAFYFVVVGAFKDFLDGFFLINAQYTEAVPFSRNPRGLWGAFEDAYGVSLYFLVVGMATLLTLTVVTLLVKSRRQASNGASLIAIGAAAAWGIAWTYHDINGWPDLFVLLPFGAVGIGALAHEVVRHVQPRWRCRWQSHGSCSAQQSRPPTPRTQPCTATRPSASNGSRSRPCSTTCPPAPPCNRSRRRSRWSWPGRPIRAESRCSGPASTTTSTTPILAGSKGSARGSGASLRPSSRYKGEFPHGCARRLRSSINALAQHLGGPVCKRLGRLRPSRH